MKTFDKEAFWQEEPNLRLNVLVFLVFFVFAILLISMAAAGTILYALIRLGVAPTFKENNFPGLLFFILLISLGMGTILSATAGNRFLRPLRRVIQGTREVATGNFAVRVEPQGPYELRQLAISFNDMAGELGGIETLRNDFVSNISHEFKTPVVSIRGFAKLLKNEELSSAQREEYLDIIIQESERLAQLSSNVLLQSQLDNTEKLTEKEAYPLDEQLRQAVLLLDPQLSKKDIDVEVELPAVSVTANGEMLQQIWLNLLQNAIKFTQAGGDIRVALTEGEKEVSVEIADNGIGMDEESQKRIFDKFYQGDASHNGEGNGLGLSLVKRIVDLHGGTIEVSSAMGEGSSFTVSFPK